MTEHTKGMWHDISVVTKKGWEIHVKSKDGVLIHSAPKTPMSTKTKIANAKLIASAPRLLKDVQIAKKLVNHLLESPPAEWLNNLQDLQQLKFRFDMHIFMATGEME